MRGNWGSRVMKNRTKPQRTSISMTPSEMAQIREWATERGLSVSHFLKQAADAYIRNENESNKDNSAEKQTALTVNISNRLTDIEHVLGNLKTVLVVDEFERQEPQSTEAAQAREAFQSIYAEMRRALQALTAEMDRASKINAAQEHQLRLLLTANDDPNKQRTFTERLMHKMRL